VIDALGLPGFFLLHRDLLELARDVAVELRGPSVARQLLPPGRGRGYSVSSVVCYLTGLSHIDPVDNDLQDTEPVDTTSRPRLRYIIGRAKPKVSHSWGFDLVYLAVIVYATIVLIG
jgi:hypothetical protein